jgi:predicted glycogen debranching enzyme
MPRPDSLFSEWLEADGLGGFASGTVSGIRTRRYHALLLAATTPPSGRMVLVNGLDAEVETAGGVFAISTQRYAPATERPDGVSRLIDFSPEPWPRWTYALPEGEITQELFVPRGSAVAALRWTWHGAGAAHLRVMPFLSGRDFHAMHHQNPAFRFEPETTGDVQRWTVYPAVPAILARSNGVYHHQPNWYNNFFYSEELARGMETTEDLAAPGIYEFDLASGPAVLLLSAGDSPPSPLPVAHLVQQMARREQARRATFATPHLRSADAYFVRRGKGQTLIAGYPWFGDWGRDTFIALRGFCLATGRLADAREILTAWAGYVSQGMLPNRFPDAGDEPEYNSVDASLWYVIAVSEYLELAPDEGKGVRETLLAAVDAILAGYSRGTRFGIRADSDGLLACGEPGVQLTWMDAKVGDWVVTPRIGKPVEVQALWLNALALAGKRHPPWRLLFVRGLTAFQDRFWNEAKGCLFDVIDVGHRPGATDDRVRPNQIFAVGGLPLPLVDGNRARRLIQTVQDKLWTPMGPRSLAPDEPDFAPSYHGGVLQRDGSYHQGTVWPWLTGAFVEAWVRIRHDTPESKREARALFLQTLSRLDLPGLRHVPEIADATEPFTARGCPFQAWSQAELLRLEYKVLN